LRLFVEDFAGAIERVDKMVPPAKNKKSDLEYDRGIGPYQENIMIQYVIEELKKLILKVILI